jgi:hypothetical protein
MHSCLQLASSRSSNHQCAPIIKARMTMHADHDGPNSLRLHQRRPSPGLCHRSGGITLLPGPTVLLWRRRWHQCNPLLVLARLGYEDGALHGHARQGGYEPLQEMIEFLYHSWLLGNCRKNEELARSLSCVAFEVR